MTIREKLRHLRAHEDDAFAFRRQFLNNAVNILLCPDIDTARRIVQKQHLGILEQPFRKQNFLLVAPAQTATSILSDAAFSRMRP